MTKRSFLFFGSVFFLTAVGLLPKCAHGEDYYVGTCAHGKANFTTIGKAVAAVPAGSVIDICPGTYPEQVVIEKPLTLHGVAGENGGAVVVTVPASGLKLNIKPHLPDVCGDTCTLNGAAQISAVNVDGTVNISDIVVDGANAALPSTSLPVLTGFNFDSTPVNLDHVEVRNEYLAADHSSSPTGYGVVVADTHGKKTVVSIVSSHLYRFSNTGIESSGKIVVDCNSIDLRTISGVIGVFGIWQSGASAVITNNIITGNDAPALFTGTNSFLGIGIQSAQAESSIDGNTVSNALLGIYSAVGYGQRSELLTIEGNRLVDNQTAIIAEAQAAPSFLIERNSITGFGGQSGISTGISFTCGVPLPTLNDNSFYGTSVALAGVPAGTAQATGGHYHNVGVLNQTCP